MLPQIQTILNAKYQYYILILVTILITNFLVLISSPVVIKYSDKSNLGRKDLYCLKVQGHIVNL